MFKTLISEIDSFFSRDPAAKSRLEIVLCYPGFHALVIHRLANWLWRNNARLAGRFIAYIARIFTGIEIHPAAKIGKNLFIDHGMGVVIGETAAIGDNVTIYHDVTLGGVSLKDEIRHPQVGDDVIIGAGAQLLGPIKVGNGARIGSNAVVVKDVEAGKTVVGIPARVVEDNFKEEHKDKFESYGSANNEEDPIMQVIKSLQEQVQNLQSELHKSASKWDSKS